MRTAADKRRERLRRLLAEEPDVSNRAAGRRLAVDHKTIARDRARLAEREGVHRPPAPPQGNQRAVTHGATSELRVGPLRQRHAEALRAEFPWLDDRRLAILADTAARCENAATFMDPRPVVCDSQMNTWPLLDRVDRWQATLWRMLREVAEEARERAAKPADLEAYLAEVYGDEPTDSEPEGGTDAE